jgi:PelA/Pel-15E family pectate lyase
MDEMRKSHKRLQWFLLSLAIAITFGGQRVVIAQRPGTIDVSSFSDSAHHWRKLRDETRVIQPEPGQPAYREDQVREIAGNILLYQRANGGWPKDYDMLAVLTEDQRRRIVESRTSEDTSFDNHNTFSQVEYLAKAFGLTRDDRFRDACVRGLDFMLAAQYPNGGIPQWFPRTTGYHGHITFNDGAMIGALRVLKDAADGKAHFAWLDAGRRAKAEDAVRRGVDCILKCQIRVDGRLTGWCQQHDERTYEPVGARTFELASICPGDTSEIVQFLMSVKSPTPTMIQSIDAAVKWMKQVSLPGLVIKRVPAPKEDFPRYSADFDIVALAEAGARPIWARHYEMGTNRPIFAGRDGVKKYNLADIERERRCGTLWYGYWPESVIATEYGQWKTRIGKNAAANR